MESAIVIFTSDHGDCLCAPGHSQKWTMYDTITHMPLIIWSPGRFTGGRKLDSLCQQMDIAPAILELAGTNVPGHMEAQSLLPALRGEPWEGRPYVLSEHGKDEILQTTDFMTMVRSQAWKLLHFLDEPFGQLFNLIQDPGEVHNLWNNPAVAAKKQELIVVLCEWRIRSQYHTRDWSEAWR